MTALWVVASVGAAWWVWQSVCVVRTLRAVRPLPAGTIDVAGNGVPLVSVICPARDEADAIEAATLERLSDPAPWIEFIFVNDRSTDGTGEILDRVAASDTRAQVLHIDELPDGWLGKVHAQRVGLEHAAIQSDGWYLFSDGDTHVHPGCIAAALAWAEQEQADHVALTPRIVKGSWLLRLCIAPLMRTLLCTLRLWLANDDSQPRAMGVGAFNLVRRPALERAGGLQQLRLEIADDVGIARIVKDVGGRSRVAIGAAWLEIEWYRTASQFLRGSEKGVAKARTRKGIVLSAMAAFLVVAIDVSPFALLLWFPFTSCTSCGSDSVSRDRAWCLCSGIIWTSAVVGTSYTLRNFGWAAHHASRDVACPCPRRCSVAGGWARLGCDCSGGTRAAVARWPKADQWAIQDSNL